MVHSHPQRHGVGHVMMSLVGNPAEEFQTGVEMEKREGWGKKGQKKIDDVNRGPQQFVIYSLGEQRKPFSEIWKDSLKPKREERGGG